jgi:hypothetical protein
MQLRNQEILFYDGSQMRGFHRRSRHELQETQRLNLFLGFAVRHEGAGPSGKKSDFAELSGIDNENNGLSCLTYQEAPIVFQ